MADALPPADEYGLLPPGVHPCSWEEFERRYARFQRSDRRLRLCARLKEYLDALHATGWSCELIVDGSLVMGCVDEPDDIDLILVLPADWDWAADLRPFEYNVVSKRAVRRDYRFDVKTVEAGSSDEANYLDFFQGVNIKWQIKYGIPSDRRKGLPRMTIIGSTPRNTSP